MGISGLLSGGTLLGVVGLISGLFATFSPMWLITRVELHNRLCWTGHGLWVSNFVWGEDIPEMHLTCQGDTVNTYEAYCKNEGRSEFEKHMCSPMNASRSLMVLAQILGFLVLVLAFFLGSSKLHQHQRLNYSREIRLSKWICFLAFTTSASACVGFFLIYTSELFSTSHAREVSKDFVNPFESSTFGCAFQSPLRASNKLEALLKSSPLNCIYGGPSFAMAVCSFVSWFLSGWFFWILLGDVIRLEDVVVKSVAGLDSTPGGATPMPSVRHPLVTSLLYPRYYSIYGAMSRRFESNAFRKTYLLTLPLLSLATGTAFAVMMLMNGAAVDVFIQLSSPLFSHPSNYSQLTQHYPAHRFSTNEAGQPVLEIIEEVFDFTMLTSIKNFWDGKAYALALLTAVFCAAWPYARIAIQLYLFFVPVKETIRGRTLTWMDALGKWAIVNTFVLCFMGVSFHLQSELRLKSFLGMKDILNVGIEVKLAPRMATYIFVITVMVSIVISEVFVYVHRKCKDWEEARNFIKENHQVDASQEDEDAGNPPPLPSVVQYKHGFGYESLCDRHQNILPGKVHVFTQLSNVLVFLALGLTVCTTLSGMLEVGMAFTFGGVVGKKIVDEHEVRREFSLVSIGTSIETEMGSEPAGGKLLTAVFFLVAFVGPLLRIAGLSVMWFVPMRPSQAQSCFHLMEVIESWSALDVYFVSTLAATLEIGSLSKVILGGSFPAVEELVDQYFPSFGGLFALNQELLPGMYLICAAVVLEKGMSLFIIAQAANAVAERLEEEKMSLKRHSRRPPGSQEENELFDELVIHPETLAVLSPSARYASASGAPTLQYSGLPRIIWTTGIRLGLLRELDDEDGDDEGAAYSPLGDE